MSVKNVILRGLRNDLVRVGTNAAGQVTNKILNEVRTSINKKGIVVDVEDPLNRGLIR